MKLTSLFVFLLLFCAVHALPQDVGQIFQARDKWEFFEESTVMRKVVVCAEDQSVWAVSDAGKVFYKPDGASVFSLFAATANVFVTDIAGYNANEMYFSTNADRLYQFKNMGSLSEIILPGSLQGINGIAVVYASRNTYLEGYHGKRDWLAVATYTLAHSLFRDDGTFASFTPVSTGSTPNVKITNSGYKSLDFQYKVHPASQCFGNLTTAYYNKVGTQVTETLLPELEPLYDGIVYCTYFEDPFNQQKDGGRRGFDYWGTSKGLFVKQAGSCDLRGVKKVLDGKINDLEELNFFRDIFNDKVTLAGADDGLYYSVRSPFPEGTAELDRIGFTKFFDFDRGINSIALELNGFEGAGKLLCHTAVWLATTKGIVKIPLAPAKKNVDKNVSGIYGPLVSMSGGSKFYYCVSNGEDYTFNVHLPNNDQVNYWVEWHMDKENYAARVELEQYRKRNPFTTHDRGWYAARIVSGCGEIVDVGPYWLRDPESINVNFDYDPVESMLKGCSFTFSTNPGGPYQWRRDGQLLTETSNVYEAKVPGVYQLSYMDPCSGEFVPMPSVQLNEIDVPAPVITRNRNLSLCYGETVMLSVEAPDINGITFTYKWQRNGNPISDEVSRELEADLPGNYDVTLMLGECSVKRSATAVVVINEALKLATPPAVQICTIRAQRLKLTAPEGFAKYTWDGAEGTANFLEVTEPGQYTLDVEDASGCTASTTYIVVPYCAPPVPPNVFSPNGDGVNDLWTVAGLEDDPDAKIHVYNRFGVSVFDGSAKQPSWNGKLRGTDVPDGTYYYVVIKSSAKPITGSLVLIR